jgi:lysophospholipase L1-like esterase
MTTPGALALLLLFLGVTLLSAVPTKKRHTTASLNSSSANGHVTRRSAAARKRRPRRRIRYYMPRVNPALRAKLLVQIGTRLKDPAPNAISYSTALDGFYTHLAAYENSLHEGETPAGTLRVIQWGDSHTASDTFTGETRRLFQQQFGDGGIGFAYAGHPFAGYRIFGSKQAQSFGWMTEGNKFLQLGDGQLGMGGISISTDRPGEWVTLDAQCTSLELQFLEQPNGGSLLFTDNGGDPVRIDTAAQETAAGTFHYNCPAGEHLFEITTADSAPVTLLGWVATQPGVTWESIGINGAEAPLMLRWNQQLFSQYLKENAPSLVVLAYGTNEASSMEWNEESYKQTFASIVDTIHEYVPESSILVLGPADRAVIHHRAWHAFPGTDKIIEAQRAVCRTHGCAYWDERKRMGGFGSMQQWVYAGWAQPDHTHFTGDGYRALADALMSDLMAGFQEYKERSSQNTESAVQGDASGAGSTNP